MSTVLCERAGVEKLYPIARSPVLLAFTMSNRPLLSTSAAKSGGCSAKEVKPIAVSPVMSLSRSKTSEFPVRSDLILRGSMDSPVLSGIKLKPPRSLSTPKSVSKPSERALERKEVVETALRRAGDPRNGVLSASPKLARGRDRDRDRRRLDEPEVDDARDLTGVTTFELFPERKRLFISSTASSVGPLRGVVVALELAGNSLKRSEDSRERLLLRRGLVRTVPSEVRGCR